MEAGPGIAAEISKKGGRLAKGRDVVILMGIQTPVDQKPTDQRMMLLGKLPLRFRQGGQGRGASAGPRHHFGCLPRRATQAVSPVFHPVCMYPKSARCFPEA